MVRTTMAGVEWHRFGTKLGSAHGMAHVKILHYQVCRFHQPSRDTPSTARHNLHRATPTCATHTYNSRFEFPFHFERGGDPRMVQGLHYQSALQGSCAKLHCSPIEYGG